eukprot:6459902-Amphidinium_carterae.1
MSSVMLSCVCSQRSDEGRQQQPAQPAQSLSASAFTRTLPPSLFASNTSPQGRNKNVCRARAWSRGNRNKWFNMTNKNACSI